MSAKLTTSPGVPAPQAHSQPRSASQTKSQAKPRTRYLRSDLSKKRIGEKDPKDCYLTVVQIVFDDYSREMNFTAKNRDLWEKCIAKHTVHHFRNVSFSKIGKDLILKAVGAIVGMGNYAMAERTLRRLISIFLHAKTLGYWNGKDPVEWLGEFREKYPPEKYRNKPKTPPPAARRPAVSYYPVYSYPAGCPSFPSPAAFSSPYLCPVPQNSTPPQPSPYRGPGFWELQQLARRLIGRADTSCQTDRCLLFLIGTVCSSQDARALTADMLQGDFFVRMKTHASSPAPFAASVFMNHIAKKATGSDTLPAGCLFAGRNGQMLSETALRNRLQFHTEEMRRECLTRGTVPPLTKVPAPGEIRRIFTRWAKHRKARTAVIDHVLGRKGETMSAEQTQRTAEQARDLIGQWAEELIGESGD